MEDVQPSFGTVLSELGSTPAAVGSAISSHMQVMEVTVTTWNSGSVVRLLSGGEALRVIGCDSVGSVICRPLGDDSHLGIHVPPSLLMPAEAPFDDRAPAHSDDLAMENA